MTQMVFDGHNDLLSRLWCMPGDPVANFESDAGHVNEKACKSGDMVGGFFAMYSQRSRVSTDFTTLKFVKGFEPLAPELDEAPALQSAIGQAGIALQLQKAGKINFVTRASDLGAAVMGDGLAGILHLEGADCIDPEFRALEVLYELGMRSLGIVWSRPTIFGDGVPFGYDHDGDTGPGLTEDGHRLVKRCKELGIIIDTSHLTMKGFWDVADAGVPLVATHSNATAVCKVTRNLTDDQLRAVAETKGVVGLNFAAPFLDMAAYDDKPVGVDACIRNLDHMIEIAGEDHVALGSDFDGAPLPDGLQTAADLPNLIGAMERAGYGQALIAKIAAENWLDFLDRAL